MGRLVRWLVVLGALSAFEVAAQERLSVDTLKHDVLLLRELAIDQGRFGSSLQVVGSRLAIGKPETKGEKGTGEAVFLVEPDGTLFATVRNPTSGRAEQFGFALASDGKQLFVAESGMKAKASGRVHVIDAATGKLTATWEHRGPAAENAGSGFGEALLAMGGDLVVGAPYQNCNGIRGAGAVYLFDTAAGTLKETICDPEPHRGGGGWFGLKLAPLEQQLLVTAYSPRSGNDGSGVVKVLAAGKLVRSVMSAVPESSGFGASMAMVGGQLAIGVTRSEPRAAVFLYDPQTWKKTSTIPSPSTSGFFGSTMVAAGDDLLIGEVSGGAFEGTVWLIDSRSGKVKRTFHGHGGFGAALAVWGDYFVIASPRLRGDEGGVYLFPREGPAEMTVEPPQPIDFSIKGAWASVSSEETSRVVRVGKVLLAAGKGGVMRSGDSGRTWSPSIGGEATALAAFEGTAFVAIEKRGLFTSKNAGKTWSLRALVDSVHAMDTSEHGLAVGTDRGEVLLSKNGGANWQALCLGFPETEGITTIAAVPGGVLFRTGTEAYRAELLTGRCDKQKSQASFAWLSRGMAGEVLSTECDVRTTEDGKRWTYPAERDAQCMGPSFFGHTTALTSGDSVFLASDVGHLVHKRGPKEQSLTQIVGPDAFGTKVVSLVLMDDAVVAATPNGLRRYRFPDGEAPLSTEPASRIAALQERCSKGVASDCATVGEWLHFAGKKTEARAALLAGCEKGGESECALLVDLVLAPEKSGRSLPALLPKMEKAFAQACQRGVGRSCWRQTVLLAEADAGKKEGLLKKACAAKRSDPQSCPVNAGVAKAPAQDPKAVATLTKSCQSGDDVACRALAKELASQERLREANPELAVLLADRLCREGVGCEAVAGWLNPGTKAIPRDKAREFSLYERLCYQDRAVACYLASVLCMDSKVVALRESFTDASKSNTLRARGEELFVTQCGAGDLSVCLDLADYLRSDNKGEAMKRAQSTCQAGHAAACERQKVWALDDRCAAREGQGCLELALFEEGRKKGATYIAKLRRQACEYGATEACTSVAPPPPPTAVQPPVVDAGVLPPVPPPTPPVAAKPPPDAARVAEIARCLEPKNVDVKACWELGNKLTKIDGETVVDETTARRVWDRACSAGHCLSCGASRELGGVVRVDLAALEAKSCTAACAGIGDEPETTYRGSDACELLVEVHRVKRADTGKVLAALERACRSMNRCGPFIAALESSDLPAAEQKRLTPLMSQRCAGAANHDDASCTVWSRRVELKPLLNGCTAGQGPACHAAGELIYRGSNGASGLGEFARGCDVGWGPSCIKVANDELHHGTAERAGELTKKAEGLCEEGQTAACLALASAYFDGELAKGRNKTTDDVWRMKAQGLELRACDGGDAIACRRLGEMFRDGTGGEKSPARSMEALKKACDGGDGDGCAMLSWAFTNGRDVPAEPARAVALALRGCSLGSKDGCYKLSRLLGRSDIGDEDRAKGKALLAQQCKLGEACHEL